MEFEENCHRICNKIYNFWDKHDIPLCNRCIRKTFHLLLQDSSFMILLKQEEFTIWVNEVSDSVIFMFAEFPNIIFIPFTRHRTFIVWKNDKIVRRVKNNIMTSLSGKAVNYSTFVTHKREKVFYRKYYFSIISLFSLLMKQFNLDFIASYF